MLASRSEKEEEEGEAKITRCQSNSGILGESDGATLSQTTKFRAGRELGHDLWFR